jgi:hypothetical protein
VQTLQVSAWFSQVQISLVAELIQPALDQADGIGGVCGQWMALSAQPWAKKPA